MTRGDDDRPGARGDPRPRAASVDQDDRVFSTLDAGDLGWYLLIGVKLEVGPRCEGRVDLAACNSPQNIAACDFPQAAVPRDTGATTMETRRIID